VLEVAVEGLLVVNHQKKKVRKGVLACLKCMGAGLSLVEPYHLKRKIIL
jgi:hypothetical protein